jgi:hypothetical protein
MRGTALGQLPPRAGKLAGLAYRRVQPRERHELARHAESLDVAYFADDGGTEDTADARDRRYDGIRFSKELRYLPVKVAKLLFEKADLFE